MTPFHLQHAVFGALAARARQSAGNERGLTLVEIMIVLTIMASIMGLVGVVASNAIERGKVREAQIQAGQLANAVEEYYVYVDEWPDSLSDLVNPPGGVAGFVEEVPNDPWGNDYRYDRSEQQVCSNGKDGSSGGSDDICSE